MAPKRRLDGDGVGESPGELAKPMDMDGDTTQSSAEFAKPVYLVAVREDDPAAYSVLQIDAAAVASGDGDDEPPRVRSVAGLPIADEPGMSFVAAHSKHGSWIVGVGGGQRARTIIFDPRTLETFQGPRLAYPKHEPILISHGGELQQGRAQPRVRRLGPLGYPSTATLLPLLYWTPMNFAIHPKFQSRPMLSSAPTFWFPRNQS
ncbi:hypothetical protein HU200_030913 [Digitaria exilis]|uniref:Uncharacterized protein n=1 Tax=Digitaria exilis TaxID=1010633 RepID=A0A835BNA1_9POAL|nr:hypothetical protein HU200_030913 [Digitaria exilis]